MKSRTSSSIKVDAFPRANGSSRRRKARQRCSSSRCSPVNEAVSARTEAPPTAGWPLLRLGFRPFYLGAALFAVLAIPLWIALFLGQLTLPLAVPPLLWHSHEMLFGFAVAVIVGFLLTAGKAWTGLATPRGAFLGVLVLLWAAARVAAVVGPYLVYALLDLVLLPLVAAVMVDLLVRALNRRNLPLAGILALLSLANGAFHLAVIGTISIAQLSALHAGLQDYVWQGTVVLVMLARRPRLLWRERRLYGSSPAFMTVSDGSLAAGEQTELKVS